MQNELASTLKIAPNWLSIAAAVFVGIQSGLAEELGLEALGSVPSQTPGG